MSHQMDKETIKGKGVKQVPFLKNHDSKFLGLLDVYFMEFLT
jgi:hypothetical protein